MKIKKWTCALFLPILLVGCSSFPNIHQQPEILTQVEPGTHPVSAITYRIDSQKFDLIIPNLGKYQGKDIVFKEGDSTENQITVEVGSDNKKTVYIQSNDQVGIGYSSYSKAITRHTRAEKIDFLQTFQQ